MTANRPFTYHLGPRPPGIPELSLVDVETMVFVARHPYALERQVARAVPAVGKERIRELVSLRLLAPAQIEGSADPLFHLTGHGLTALGYRLPETAAHCPLHPLAPDPKRLLRHLTRIDANLYCQEYGERHKTPLVVWWTQPADLRMAFNFPAKFALPLAVATFWMGEERESVAIDLLPQDESAPRVVSGRLKTYRDLLDRGNLSGLWLVCENKKTREEVQSLAAHHGPSQGRLRLLTLGELAVLATGDSAATRTRRHG